METQGNGGQGATKTESQTGRIETQRQNLRQGAQERAEPTHQLADGVGEGGRDGAVVEGAVRGSTKAGAEQQQQQQGGLGAGSPLLTPHPQFKPPPILPPFSFPKAQSISSGSQPPALSAFRLLTSDPLSLFFSLLLFNAIQSPLPQVSLCTHLPNLAH